MARHPKHLAGVGSTDKELGSAWALVAAPKEKEVAVWEVSDEEVDADMGDPKKAEERAINVANAAGPVAAGAKWL